MIKIRACSVLIVATLFLTQCNPPDAPTEVVAVEKPAVEGTLPPATSTPEGVAHSVPTPTSCQQIPEGILPIWIRPLGIVVTRMLQECTTPSGNRGYRTNSAWMAMGFPCSGGSGRLDIKGNYYDPKIVSFVLSNDCPMEPSPREKVAELASPYLNTTAEAKLVAFNPFAVQYWEIAGLPDADVGFTIDLRSVEGRQRVWKNFTENRPITTTLYGRENAWSPGNNIYAVEAKLMSAGQHSFKLEVVTFRILTEKEVADVKARCEALVPRRDCHLVF